MKRLIRIVVFFSCGLILLLAALAPKTPTPTTGETLPAQTLESTTVPQSIAASPTSGDTAAALASPTVKATASEPVTEKSAITNMLPGVKGVYTVNRSGGDYWAIVRTFANFNTQSFAVNIFIAAQSFDPMIDRFAVKIADDTSDPMWHIYDASKNLWTSSADAPSWVQP